MSRLIVVTGPPGAGKSTVAPRLARRFDPSALVAGDEFFAMVRRGYIDPWTRPAHQQNQVVIAAAAAAAGRLVRGGYTVVYDGVIGPWFLDAFIDASGLDEVDYVMLLPPERVCLRRIEDRTGHGFSDHEAASHMYRQFDAARATGAPVVDSAGSPESIVSTVGDWLQRGALCVSARAGGPHRFGPRRRSSI